MCENRYFCFNFNSTVFLIIFVSYPTKSVTLSKTNRDQLSTLNLLLSGISGTLLLLLIHEYNHLTCKEAVSRSVSASGFETNNNKILRTVTN